jgi:hypothetical protein
MSHYNKCPAEILVEVCLSTPNLRKCNVSGSLFYLLFLAVFKNEG